MRGSHNVFQTHNVPVEYFFIPMAFAIAILMCVPLSLAFSTLTDSLMQAGRASQAGHPPVA
jgi:hypothetical protein